jgi:hypothetical protein
MIEKPAFVIGPADYCVVSLDPQRFVTLGAYWLTVTPAFATQFVTLGQRVIQFQIGRFTFQDACAWTK